MAFTKYESKKISPERLAVIEQANQICRDYADQGMVLTLRQLYYQFVARDLIANKQSEYDRLGAICRDARMAGLMDWDHLIDRTRNIANWKSYRGPQAAIEELAKRYHRDMWAPQKRRIEVWIEKDAAIGVVEGVCSSNRVPYFSCRGYTSMSEMHEAAQRIRWHIEQGEQVTILHVGDHDPSGLDMSRDIQDRLATFINVDWIGLHMGGGSYTKRDIREDMRDYMNTKRRMPCKDCEGTGFVTYPLGDERCNYCVGGTRFEGLYTGERPWELRRIALNIEQIEEYNPPPNPVKLSDGRSTKYVEETGLTDSWELDALDPQVMNDLIQEHIDEMRDDEIWADEDFKMETERTALVGIGNWWNEVSEFVGGKN